MDIANFTAYDSPLVRTESRDNGDTSCHSSFPGMLCDDEVAFFALVGQHMKEPLGFAPLASVVALPALLRPPYWEYLPLCSFHMTATAGNKDSRRRHEKSLTFLVKRLTSALPLWFLFFEMLNDHFTPAQQSIFHTDLTLGA